MFDLPNFPDVFTTRHINCVSCKEKIALTEGRDGSWVVRATVPQTVDLHYESRRQQRPVVPTPRQVQQPKNGRIALPNSYELVNCPRCGADNRNWLALKQLEGNRSFSNQWYTWQQRFPKIRLALGISLLFSAVALLLPLLFKVSWPKAIFLALVIPTFAILLIAEMSDQWDKLREDKHLAQILPQTRRLEPQLWLKSFAWLLIAAVIVPIIIFSGFPTAFQAIVEFIENPPEGEVIATAEDVKVDFNAQLNETVNNLEVFGQEMGETIDGFPDGDLPELERQKDRLADDLENAALFAAEEVNNSGQQTITQIDSQMETALDALTAARQSERRRFIDEIMADVRYLAVWGGLVGLSLLITTMMVLPDVKAFAMRVDANLPPPVFYSVANMTRLVTWEARQTLEIAEDYFFHIQWMSANRNEQGGLDLVGFFRDRPEIDIFGQPIGTMVRAQKYTIHTDMWCRILRVNLEDALVPIPANAIGEVVRVPRVVPPSPGILPTPGQPALVPIAIGPQPY